MKTGFLALTALFALIINIGFAEAAARIDRARVTQFGIYSAKVTQHINDKSISTGNRDLVNKVQLVEATAVIHAKPDMFFGLSGMTYGAPKGKSMPIRIIWRYPQPGLVNPQTHSAKLKDDYMDDIELGRQFQFFWHLTNDWQVVPGVWTFEMWDGNRLLASQSFTLVKDNK